MNSAHPHQPVVVIPVHKAHPNKDESIGITRCGALVTDIDIKFLAPSGLSLDAYRALAPRAGELRAPREAMASISAYNRYMISPDFYSLLDGYSHVLIHEPDAILLKNELRQWCSKDCDYIGAPWLEGFADAKSDAAFLGVGNFGFSLLRLSSVMQVLTSKRRWYTASMVMDDVRELRQDPRRIKRIIYGLGSAGQLRGAYKIYRAHCDIFWSFVVPALVPGFRVGTVQEALRFSWEVQPRRCFDETGGLMPMGLHAWARYDHAFATELIARQDGPSVSSQG